LTCLGRARRGRGDELTLFGELPLGRGRFRHHLVTLGLAPRSAEAGVELELLAARPQPRAGRG
jgi:hypothetical protein